MGCCIGATIWPYVKRKTIGECHFSPREEKKNQVAHGVRLAETWQLKIKQRNKDDKRIATAATTTTLNNHANNKRRTKRKKLFFDWGGQKTVGEKLLARAKI